MELSRRLKHTRSSFRYLASLIVALKQRAGEEISSVYSSTHVMFHHPECEFEEGVLCVEYYYYISPYVLEMAMFGVVTMLGLSVYFGGTNGQPL